MNLNSFRHLPVIFSFLLLSSTAGFASDHIDGPITMQDQVADITDLYAFSKKQGYLTLVMDSYPFVLKNGHFSNKLDYNFIVRKAQFVSNGIQSQIATDEASEAVINCFFTGHHEDQVVNCETNSGVAVSSKVGTIGTSNNGSVKVFAGHRADPFFLNTGWTGKVRFDGEVPTYKKNSNSTSKTNILSIIVELPVDKLFKDSGSKFAVVAETVSKESGERLDKVGRPEVTNFSLEIKDSEDLTKELRDKYNTLDLFDNSPSELAAMKTRITQRINDYDTADGEDNWGNKQDKLNALVNVILDDFLVINTDIECEGSDEYFAIEQQLLDEKAVKSCGGRKITDDMVDQQFSLYVNAGESERISDGVDAPYKAITKSFPYMATPDKSITGTAKRLAISAFGKGLRDKFAKLLDAFID